MKNIASDTIVAIATALNNSGISIIRISGDEAIEVIAKIFKSVNNKNLKDVKSHTIHYGHIIDCNEDVIDEVLVSVMRGPKSYTAENVVEINCHGGIIVTKKILDICLKNGARIAEPGEFTKRAFLNGRIDLSQAEAVTDLINAKNEYAVKSSVSQLKGRLKEQIDKIRECVIHDIAYIEAALDDPEHYDVDEYSNVLLDNVNNVRNDIVKLYKSSENGRIIKEGINTVIVGKPNAGKSSFLNALIGEERAIVTEVEGTTRDVLCEEINIDGILLNMVDTAGIRDTADVVEQIGVEKAKDYIDKSDLIIYIVDSSIELDENDRDIINIIKEKNVIVLLNKTDLEALVTEGDIIELMDNTLGVIEISAKNNIGIEQFEMVIKDRFYTGEINYNDEVYITNLRHREALSNALEGIENVLNSINIGMPEDLLLVDMMNVYSSLGLIIGEEVEDDLVDKIFKEFCMGK